MHKPKQRTFSTWVIYQFLAHYHWLQLRYLDKNFKVVFPLVDYLLGTHVRANPADLHFIHEQSEIQAPKAAPM